MKWPTVICQQCSKPVETLEWFDDREAIATRVIRAYCHGAVDEMRLDLAAMTSEQMRSLEFAVGQAFTDKSLPFTAKALLA